MLKFNKKLLVVLCVMSSSCTAGGDLKSKCDIWIKSAVKSVESVPPKDRFIKALQQLQQACEAESLGKLKQAASKCLTAPTPSLRQDILLQASAVYYPESCLDIGSGQPAKKLLHICLEDDFPKGSYTSILPHIDAASYLYGKAVEKELKNAGIDQMYSHKFMLNYFLGAAADFEERQ